MRRVDSRFLLAIMAWGCFVVTSVSGDPNLLFWDFENQVTFGAVSTSSASSIHTGLSGVASQTGGGPAEFFDRGDGYVHLTRRFGDNIPYVGFNVTDTVSLTSVVFEHLHNHNRSATTPAYEVQLQLDSGKGFVDLGGPLTLNENLSGMTSSIAFEPVELGPGTHQLRWVPRNLGDDRTNTNSDFSH